MIAQTTHGQLAEYLRNFHSRINKTAVDHIVKLETGQHTERDLVEIRAALEDLQTGIKYAINCVWRLEHESKTDENTLQK